jgi:hypothetical protein
VFIVESYKKLSPDSGDTTTSLLTQISQQLSGFQDNTYPPPQETAAFSPSLAILFVNALWFLSLVISIVAAFYLMLVRQWIRRYTQTLAELKRDQDRVRSCLFIGTQKYRMSHAIGLIPLPLHISVFLFFSGLIIFLFTISTVIAIVLSAAVVLIGLLYAALTILPVTDDVCPYFTPMSDVWWYLQHTTFTVAASGCYWVVEGIRNRSGPIIGARSGTGRLSNWSDFLKDVINRNKLHLKVGLRGNIFQHAKTAPVDVDLSTLTWLLQRPIMGERGKLQEFIDSIPPQILVQLSFIEAESGKKTIRYHLRNLFQGCLSNKDKLEEPERSQRLQICLDAFYQIVKPSSLPDDKDPETVLQFVWSNFKDLHPVRKLWDDSDPAIRIFSRSICAHLSRNILRKSKPDDSEKNWLREFVGKPEDPGKKPEDPVPDQWDHFILESFVFGVFHCLKDGLFVKPEHAACFVETLAVLMNAGNSGAFSKEIFSEEIFSFIEWAKESDHDEVAAKLGQWFSKFFTDGRAE